MKNPSATCSIFFFFFNNVNKRSLDADQLSLLNVVAVNLQGQDEKKERKEGGCLQDILPSHLPPACAAEHETQSAGGNTQPRGAL